MENARLTSWQFFTLTFFFTVGTTWIVLIGSAVNDAKQYGWLPCIWTTLFGLAIAPIWLYLYGRFPGKSLVEIAVGTLGKWAGGLVALLYVLFFVQIASWVTRNLSDFLHISLMPRTPLSVFNVMILVVCAYAAVKGIESIAMVTEMLTAYLNLAYWIPICIVLRQWDWMNFRPHVALHWAEVVRKTDYMLAFPNMETIAFMMIFPFAISRLKTAYLSGIAVAGFCLSVSAFVCIGILGVNRSSHLIYPVFALFREMQFTMFLEHLEALLAINILIMVCLKLSICFYCAVLGICQLFKIEKRSTVAYPLIWFISAYSLLFKNVIENVDWINRYLFGYYLLYGVFFPVLLIVGAWIKLRLRPALGGGATA